jgi:thiamine biosynthesis protein ThiI
LVQRQQGRIFVEAKGDFDHEDVIEALCQVFGVSAVCPVNVIEDKIWDNVAKAVGDFVEQQYDALDFSFKVESKRSDKSYPMTSPEVCVEAGAYLLERFPSLRVDVHKPEVRIWVEIREKAYVYSKVIPGVGGMPLGTNGKAMLLLSGGIDSPVAGYMIAKRGVFIDAVYFHAPPYTSERAKQKVVDLAKLVSRYTGPIRLHVINFTEIQMYIYETCPHEELTILMRRYMMRIAETLAQKNDCLGLITGESIGQVASQTMHSLAATNEVCTMPVYRPLIGFDKQDIVELAEKIDTYETSILPYEDCCTIFVAKHPVTKPDIAMLHRSEEKLTEKIDDMVQQALDSVEIIEVDAR